MEKHKIFCEELIRNSEIKDSNLKREVNEAAKYAISFMAKADIPITPENYQRMFYIVCFLKSKDELVTPKNIAKLYEEFFGKECPFDDEIDLKLTSMTVIETAREYDRISEQMSKNIDTFSGFIQEGLQAMENNEKNKIEEIEKNLQQLKEENEKLKKELETNINRLRIIEAKFAEIETYGEKDPLTGLYNRHTFEKDMKSLELQPYGLVMLDIDNFKKINDTYGHQAGDKVIKEIGLVLQNFIRKGTRTYRYGGEEFVIVLPLDSDEKQGAEKVAERIRNVIMNRAVSVQDMNGNEHNLRVTVSGGATRTYGKRYPEKTEEVINRADKALYEAKTRGKNRIIFKPFAS